MKTIDLLMHMHTLQQVELVQLDLEKEPAQTIFESFVLQAILTLDSSVKEASVQSLRIKENTMIIYI